MSVVLRPARPDDAAFLAEVLVLAAFWRPDRPAGGVEEVLRRPELAHYVAGWPRPGDLGLIAEDARPVGAAWLRFLPEDDPGYGFVDVRTPELTVGVVAARRQEGIGRRLLLGLLDAARDAGVARVSLSVEPDNPALRLYADVGFREIGVRGGAVTMLLMT